MKRSIIIESFWATVVIMLLVGLVNLINFRFEFTKPIKQEFFDFDVYDLRFSGIAKNNTTRDTNIVLIQTGPDRISIANQLLLLDSLKPKVIGVDVLFRDSSSLLIDFNFLRSLQQLQTKTIFSFRFETDKNDNKIPVKNFFSDSGTSNQEGYYDFIGDSLSSVRLYPPFLTIDKKNYSSFSSMVLQEAEPEKYKVLLHRNKKQELINYSGNLESYTFFKYADLDDYLINGQLKRKIKNKIVLLGYFEPEQPMVLEDIHFTPMNEKVNGRSLPDTYGIVIHANIISMVIAGKYLQQCSLWVSYILAFILVFFMSWFVLYIHHKLHHPLLHILLLVFVLTVIIILMGIFVMLFAWFKIKIPLLPIITGLVISVEFFDAYRWLTKMLISLPKKMDSKKYSKNDTSS